MFNKSNYTSRKMVSEILFLGLFFSFLPAFIISSAEQENVTIPFETLSDFHLDLGFSTFIGGNDDDFGYSIAVASDDSYYVTGWTESSNFPVLNGYNSTFGGYYDAFVVKFAADGSLLWSTYLGGSSSDYGGAIAVASDGSCYVAGHTESSNFPTTLNAYDSTYNGGYYDAFVSKFAADGSLLWSTYLGGSSSDYGEAIAVASDGSCYVIGYTSSSDFPTINASQNTHNGGTWDAFITKFSTNGDLLWSTYLGGGGGDVGRGIAVASDDSFYVTGWTESSNFPVLNGYNSTFGGYYDAFVSRLYANGSLLWSTFLGGSSDEWGFGISVASDDSCYVTGHTESSNFPTLNAYDSTYNENLDAFVSKFAANSSLLWSTYLGGSSDDFGFGTSIASDDSCYVVGFTYSSDYPILYAYDSIFAGFSKAVITKFDSTGSLLWSTYLGGSNEDQGLGIAVTSNSSCYVTGHTESSNFPITLNAYDNTYNGARDVFVTKIIEEEEDFTEPVIQAVQTLPASPTQLDIITIRCSVIDDNSGVHFVTLHYRVNDDSWTRVNMTHIIDTIYEINIGSFNGDKVIEYYITATDIKGNSATNDNDGNNYSFTILFGDAIAPVIDDITHAPFNPTINDSITITCAVTDASGIHSVTLYYRMNGGLWESITMTLSDSDTYEAILDLILEVDDLIEYFIEAIDNSPYYNIAVDDNDGQYYAFVIQAPPTSSTTEGVATYGFLVFMLAMPVSIMLVRKRWK